jgi:imidazolonepropionase-like amidohydrolase
VDDLLVFGPLEGQLCMTKINLHILTQSFPQYGHFDKHILMVSAHNYSKICYFQFLIKLGNLDMNSIIRLIFLTVFITNWVRNLSAQSPDLVIINATYLDVEKGQMKTGTLSIRDGMIESLRATTGYDRNTEVIDGSGKYIIPGLIDAHIHLFQSGGLYTRPDVIDLRAYRSYDDERAWLLENLDDILKRYLTCGITTVIDVGGPMANFEIRDQIKNSNAHPNLFLTGPLISTYQPAEFNVEDPPIIKVNSSEEARALVRKQLPYKPDFIKIWYITLPQQSAESTYDIVEATIDESHKHNLKVAVHATELNTAKLAIRAGADFLVHSVDNPVDEDFIRLLKENDVSYIPTMMVHEQYVEALSQTFRPTKEDYLYANPFTLGTMFDGRHLQADETIIQYKSYAPRLQEQLNEQADQREKNLKILQDENINIATGTDAGNIGTHHASSYFEEMAKMKKSGLSNVEILKASTMNAAKMIGKEKEIGHITEGMLADLVILDTNPIENLNALQNIQYIIKGGQLISPDTLIHMNPELLAQQQLNAYNAGDIDAFLQPYSDTVKVFYFPDKLQYQGIDEMRNGYGSFFRDNPDIHCHLINRIVQGNIVIDQEHVTGFSDRRELHGTAIYTIENGKIVEVRFL